MILADSHTHLYLDDFRDDRDHVINAAINSGTEYFFLPNIDKESISSMMDLAGKYPNHCFPMIGLHPTSVKEDYRDQLDIVKSELENGKFCAIGEIGIDLYWDTTYLKEQQEALRFQIDLAKESRLPVVIHSRNSFDEIFEIMDQEWEPGLTGVFHCFTGSRAQAEKITDWNFKLGIGGVVTYKNSGLSGIVETIDLRHIILETDSPYLSPVPFRGKRNESKYIMYIAEKLAQAKGIPVQEVAKITTANTLELFGIESKL